MYKYKKAAPTTLRVNNAYEGETIEQKVARFMNNAEPITDASPLIYTDRKDGVLPGYDIKTDKWEVAIDAMDSVTRAQLAKREISLGERTYDTMTEEQQKKFNEKFPKNKHNKPKPETGASTSDTQTNS